MSNTKVLKRIYREKQNDFQYYDHQGNLQQRGDAEECMEALTAAISMMEGEGWVSVDDRLPEIDEWVNVLVDYNTPHEDGSYRLFACKRDNLPTRLTTCATLRLVSDGWPVWEQGRISSGHSLRDINFVTHWMPLPQPPEADQ